MFLFLIDDFMSRNSCCISPVTTKSVLMWVFLCLPEHSSESFVLIANLHWGSGVGILLPSTQLRHGSQANLLLLTEYFCGGLTFVKLRPVIVWSVLAADFGNMLGWILWWWKVDLWVNCCPWFRDCTVYKAEVASVCVLWCFAWTCKVLVWRWWKISERIAIFPVSEGRGWEWRKLSWIYLK